MISSLGWCAVSNAAMASSDGTRWSPTATSMSSGVGLIHGRYVPGSYSVNISTLRSVTSFFQAGARVLPVSENPSQESGVGSADGASGSLSTTGTMAGGVPTETGHPVGGEHDTRTGGLDGH